MLDEAAIIRALQAGVALAPGVVGIGDDAAVLPLNDQENYVISKDILVENRHFRIGTTDAASLAHKALHVNLSDVAAMGAKPLFVLLGIAVPPALGAKWVDAFLSSFTHECKRQNVQLIGGDTTASERDFFISVTVIGRGETSRLKFRNGAKVGDVICVVGTIGEAHAGLVALEKRAEGLDALKAKSLRPDARLAEGLWLGAHSEISAMMDLSDGLYVDLQKLLNASKNGGFVDVLALRGSTDLTAACEKLRLDMRECMLAGGEDYALLFTVAGDAFENIAQAFEKKFGYAPAKIGAVMKGDGLELREDGKVIAFPYRPFSHFGEL